MASNGNSVNMAIAADGKDRQYHHGDLRAAVVAAGLRRLSDGGEGELSLRALARDVGVSATALYRHFPDKEALLDALAGEGIVELGARQARVWDAAGGGEAGFRATGFAYVEFAHDQPTLFRLTFTRCMPLRASMQPTPGENRAFELLHRAVTEVLPPDIGKQQEETAALHAWSLVHGLAMLVLDRRIAWDPAQIRAVIDLTFGLEAAD